jgi:hypothetical protein
LLQESRDGKYVRIYQPVTCFTTTYKTISRIDRRISTTLEEQNLLPAEEEGGHPGIKRCKDQLMKSKAIYEDCKRRNMNLSIACIHYQKTFDSVPHG